MSQHTHCLNCQQELQGAYCHHCGQKASTHRLSIRHFIEHDVIHGIWHVDKGILYTLRGILTRPGILAKEYIAGKRAGHFSLVTLLVLQVGLFLFLISLKHFSIPDPMINRIRSADFSMFIVKSSKWLILFTVPVVALASKKIFKKLNYNYTEHIVMSGFFMAGVLCILLVFLGLSFIPVLNTLWLLPFICLATMIYLYIGYRDAIGNRYTQRGFRINFVLQLMLGTSYLIWVLLAMMCVYVFYRAYLK